MKKNVPKLFKKYSNFKPIGFYEYKGIIFDKYSEKQFEDW